jgi:hypothetical protein
VRTATILFIGALVMFVGCSTESDFDRIDEALNDHPFFNALGVIPGPSDPYRTGQGGGDGDTTVPVAAWRVVPEPDIDYAIIVVGPKAEVPVILTWPCTLYVVYTDLPDTSIRDTVLKPAPEITGLMEMLFEFDGTNWTMTQIAPCDARFDSGFQHIEIESLQVNVRRAGQPVEYPSLVNVFRQPLDPYAYTFQAGDSIDLRLWESDIVDLPWAYLHGRDGDGYDPFQYDSLSGSWYGTWVVNDTGNHWVWFEVIDINDAIMNKTGPDRSVLWGLPYIVE